jgi:glycosidase
LLYYTKVGVGMGKNKVYYQLLNYAFNDSNNDGIGDFQGIINKLDYLKNLGVEGILLSPIHRAMSYHGYDILDYYSIDEVYGDFVKLVNKCNENNIDVMMDIVLNHTAVEHEWFLSAARYHLGLSDDDKYKDYYIFSLEEINEPGWHYYIIEGKKIWFYGSFSHNMPDLNYNVDCIYDNDPIFNYMLDMCKHYIDIGVKGFRIDAAMHIYESKQGVGDSKKNSEFFKAFSSAIHEYSKDILIVGEVSLVDKSIEEYSGLDSLFNFPICEMDSVKGMLEKAKMIKNNKSFLYANMISNHDYGVARITNKIRDEKELYMYAMINIFMPGIPFVYYGDEIGLIAEMKYRYEEYKNSYCDILNRTMMPWSDMYINSNFIVDNVVLDGKNIIEECATVGTIYNKTAEEQLKDDDNLYYWYKALIEQRDKYRDIFCY